MPSWVPVRRQFGLTCSPTRSNQRSQDPEKDPNPTPKPDESTADEAPAGSQQAEMSPQEAEQILEALAQMEQAQQMEQ